MRDPYEVLGVERRADITDIKAAYRRLAKQYHPDRAPGDVQVAEKFHEITAAYDFLRDDRLRSRYDAGEIDAAGRRRRFGNWEFDEGPAPGHEAWKAGFATSRRENGSGKPHCANGARGGADDDLHFKFSSSEREEAFRSQSMFSELFGNLRGAPRVRRRGADVTYRLKVGFEEAGCGATRRVRLPSGKRLDVRIPSGAESGQQIRLRGQGEPGLNGGAAGDALIVLDVAPHTVFRRHGNDIHMELPVSVPEAVLGARITVPTLHGPAGMTVPPGSNSGTILRLEGRGIGAGGANGAPGDHLVTLRVMLPGPGDAGFTDFVRRWAESGAYDVRSEAEGAEAPAHAREE